MSTKKRIFLIGELYRPLVPWLLYDESPKGVPAVYNLYEYLGNSSKYEFHAVIFNKDLNGEKTFPNGSKIELKKFSFPTYYGWKLMVFFKLLFYGHRKIKSDSFDLLYGLSTFSIIASILGRLNKIKSVGRIYGTILTKDVEQRNYFRLYTRFIFDILAIKIPCDQVICTLDGTSYDKVFYFFNKKREVKLLYNGMEPNLRTKLLSFPLVEEFSPTIKLCYIARLESYKRQFLGIDVIANLKEKYNINARLTIIGSGTQEDLLKKKVRDLNLGTNIVFIKEMPHQEIPAFIESQDSAMFFYEGGSLGNILWESALAGKLIITVDNADTGKIFKNLNNCFIVPDDEQLPQNIARLIAKYKDKRIEPITAASRSLVERIISTWETRFDKEFKFLFEETNDA